ncbi:DUF1615 domain-containing protein [Chitinimonas arctica]|uniref:DUF1615 domain-containing protein n=1 Tax=Chitinimonas arctica TaxID=2594795 RepID=A0A516SD16_9NEIS|nr:DUF1615 domain-containing protein [Chitinimonas arctica]QDQ26046.1 DUF1615 domain-containing protein [Chitinimonas arctica]
MSSAFFARPFSVVALASLLAACATQPIARAPDNGLTPPIATVEPGMQTTAEPPPNPTTTTPAIPVPVKPPPAITPGWADARQGRALLARLLPTGIPERAAWIHDIFSAFEALKIPYTAEYFCAASAVIEQESSWQADPVVPGLGKMVWGQIAAKAKSHGVPLPLVQAAMLLKSRDGRSYKARIDGLRTEREMNVLFEEMTDEASRRGLPLTVQNPIRTGGPMQVSVEFANGHARVWPYPYPVKDSIRHEVFSRRGGLYFGIAILLHYRVPYDNMLYRFADFNAGRFSSRNAAFQAAIVKLGKRKIPLDGDLLRYEGGRPSKQASGSLLAIRKLAGQLRLSSAEIERDLALEKEGGFDQTPLYRRVFELADAAGHAPLARAVLPQIKLNSPKITRKLTTEWFARRVDGRYASCLRRAG